MKKRFYLRQLVAIDRKSYVRELETTVDLIPDQGYKLQFWRDCETYGVDEAILYVRNGPYSLFADEIQAKWTSILSRIA